MPVIQIGRPVNLFACGFNWPSGVSLSGHLSATTFDAGAWMGFSADAFGYPGLPYELDAGAISIPAGMTYNIRGVTFLTAPLAQQTVPDLDFTMRIWGRAQADLLTMEVRPVVAIGTWTGADTLGTLLADNLVGALFGIPYQVQQVLYHRATPFTFNAGDRLAIDVWFRAENMTGGDVNGRWGYLQWGSLVYDMRLDLSRNLILCPDTPIETEGALIAC